MVDAHRVERSLQRLKTSTGIVITAYMPPGDEQDKNSVLVRDTALSYRDLVSDPRSVCICVDGRDKGADRVEAIAKELGVSRWVGEVNKGKLNSAIHGVRSLLEKRSYDYLAVVDQDGDHFANELLNFIRAGEHIKAETGQERVLVLGRRTSKHRPMGFLRGELEEFVDRILLDALSWYAAVNNRPLKWEHAFALEDYPDFHSGYKVFTEATARDVFFSEPRLAGVSDECYYRHSVEAVAIVEALLSGAYLGVVNRSTFNEQPVSAFGKMGRAALFADAVIWPCKRLGVPWLFVRQWMKNHTPRLLLNSLAPDGKKELEDIRKVVFKAYGQEEGAADAVTQPLFV